MNPRNMPILLSACLATDYISCGLWKYKFDFLNLKFELSCWGSIARLNCQIAACMHVCPDYYDTCSENFKLTYLNVWVCSSWWNQLIKLSKFSKILTCIILVNNFQRWIWCLHLKRELTWTNLNTWDSISLQNQGP